MIRILFHSNGFALVQLWHVFCKHNLTKRMENLKPFFPTFKFSMPDLLCRMFAFHLPMVCILFVFAQWAVIHAQWMRRACTDSLNQAEYSWKPYGSIHISIQWTHRERCWQRLLSIGCFISHRPKTFAFTVLFLCFALLSLHFKLLFQYFGNQTLLNICVLTPGNLCAHVIWNEPIEKCNSLVRPKIFKRIEGAQIKCQPWKCACCQEHSDYRNQNMVISVFSNEIDKSHARSTVAFEGNALFFLFFLRELYRFNFRFCAADFFSTRADI